MRIRVTGGTGVIGRPLVAALVAGGHSVVVLTRNPAKVKGMDANVQLVAWDGRTADGWSALVDGADAIVNLAGEGIADGRWSLARKKAIRESRVNAGAAIVEAVEQAAVKPKVVVQASAVGYYGIATGDEEVTETVSPGSDFLAKVCFDWEISTASLQRFGIRRPILRTGVVLSNEGGAYPKMKMPVSLFAGGPIGSGKQWLPWIHIEDQVRAIQFLLEHESATGPFNLAAPAPVTNKQFIQALGKMINRPSFLPTPGVAMQLLFGEMAVVLLEGQRAVPAALQALGFEFKYATLEAALAALNPKPVTAPVATGATGAAGVAPEETPAVATAGVSEQAAAPATEDVAEQVKA
jgi:uncharacterized protein (TIGR01777 family)